MSWGRKNTISIEQEIDLDDYRDEILQYLEENPEEKDNPLDDIIDNLEKDIHSIILGETELNIDYLKVLINKLKEID